MCKFKLTSVGVSEQGDTWAYRMSCIYRCTETLAVNDAQDEDAEDAATAAAAGSYHTYRLVISLHYGTRNTMALFVVTSSDNRYTDCPRIIGLW